MVHPLSYDASAEAVFQHFRLWALGMGIKVPAMPVYDFGHLLNNNSADFIGPDLYLKTANGFSSIVEQHGYRLPYPVCAFLNRYHSPDVDYLVLAVGVDHGHNTDITWYQWSKRSNWSVVSQALLAKQDIQYRLLLPGDPILFRNTQLTALGSGLYLIYERGEATEARSRPPAVTKGRSSVHPLAPTSVITVHVNQTKLAAQLQPAASVGRPKAPHNRAAATPHYKHPRYKNARGTVGYRKATKVHGGGDPKIYQVSGPSPIQDAST